MRLNSSETGHSKINFTPHSKITSTPETGHSTINSTEQHSTHDSMPRSLDPVEEGRVEEVLAAVEELRAAIVDGCGATRLRRLADAVRDPIETLAGALDSITAQRRAAAEAAAPGLGGHRLYAPAGNGAHRCTRCPSIIASGAIEAGAVPRCGVDDACRLGAHFVMLALDSEPGQRQRTSHCLYCPATFTPAST